MFIQFEFANKSIVAREFKIEEYFYLDGLKFKPVCNSKDFTYAISKKLEFFSIPRIVLQHSRIYKNIDFQEINENEVAERLINGDNTVIALVEDKYYRSVKDFDVFAELVANKVEYSTKFLIQ